MLVLYPQQQFFNSSGGILSGGKIYTYQSGTSTPKVVYSDSTGVTALSNPVILNANGMAAFWLNGSYKVVIQDSNGVQVSSNDNVSYSPYQSSGVTEWLLQTLTSLTYISATQFSCTSDQTPTFQVNRRVQATVSAGTVYGTITASAYAAGVTTVTVIWDTGSLDSGLSAVYVGILSETNLSVPQGLVIPSFYQDALKTKLMAVPAVASDTLAVLAATQTFSGGKTFSGATTFSGAATFTGGTTGATGAFLNIQYLTSGTVYTPTTGTKTIVITVIGGGGGGGGSYGASATNAGGGGGGGAWAIKRFTGVTGTYSYSIGAGGAGGVGGAAGGGGGTTTFTGPGAVTVSTSGGGGGTQGSSPNTVPGGLGGQTALNGDINCYGNQGFDGFTNSAYTRSGSGATTIYGGGGVGVGVQGNGNAGTGVGSGGGGAMTVGVGAAQNGGAGANGGIVVYEYD